MYDNKGNILFRNLGLKSVMFSQFKEFNCEQELSPLQTRMYYLMLNGLLIRGENESLYGWCGRIGLSNSTIFGIFKKNNKNMHLSVAKKISDATGANIQWIQKGIGEPFIKTENMKGLDECEPTESTDNNVLDKYTLEKAFFTLEQALNTTKKMMATKDRAEFIARIYKSLRENDGIELEVLADCIFTLEEALKLKRQVMSYKAKSDLIFTIYELYSGNASYKDEMQSIINQLIGS